MGFCIWWELLLMVACPQVCGYFYTVKCYFYTGRAPQSLNKVTWAMKPFKTWLLQQDFELPICVDNK